MSSIKARVRQRLQWEIEVKAVDPIHLGSGEGDEQTDMALIRDGQGRLIIPGTGLTGAVRAALDNQASFGCIKGASSIFVEDAVVSNEAQVMIRQHVRIDRITGAAADKGKFDRAVIQRGATFKLTITAEERTDSEEALEVLASIRALLNGPGIKVGGAKTRGLGRIKLKEDSPDVEVLDLTKQGVLAWLRSEPSRVTLQDKVLPPQKLVRVEIGWKPEGAFMVKHELEGAETKILPYWERDGDGAIRLVLPGSSIKGPFRAEAERIMRTLLGVAAAGDSNSQIKVHGAKEIFGFAPEGKGDDSACQGALGADDCVSESTLGDIEEILTEDKKSAGDGKLKKSTKVAIDRWTGGASDGALYSVLEPHGVEWRPMVIELDLDRAKQAGAERDTALWLLSLLLIRAAQGEIPLGFGSTRGMGDWTMTSLKFTGWPPELGDPPALNANGLVEVGTKAREILGKAARNFVKESRKGNGEENSN